MRRLLEKRTAGSDLAARIRLTSGARMARFAARHSSQAIAYRAAEALRAERPAFSAGTGQARSIVTAVLVAATAVLALVAPGVTAHVFEIVLGLVFLAWTALRLLGTLSLRTVRHVPKPVADHQLPTYTIVIALYREAAAVQRTRRVAQKIELSRSKSSTSSWCWSRTTTRRRRTRRR